MEYIGLFELIIITVLFVLMYFWIREFNRSKYLGDLIIKIPRDFSNKVAIGFWIVLLCFWIFFLIEASINFNQELIRYGVRKLITTVSWLFICSIYLFNNINYREIRQKGIKIVEGIIYWRDILDYKWIEEDKLVIKFIKRIPLLYKWESTIYINIPNNQRVRVEEILKEEININLSND